MTIDDRKNSLMPRRSTDHPTGMDISVLMMPPTLLRAPSSTESAPRPTVYMAPYWLVRPIKKLLASKRIKKKGEKRATEYYVR